MSVEAESLTYSSETAPASAQEAPEILRNGMKADVAKMIETAQTGWLTKYQVMYLLEHWRKLGLKLSTVTPQKPPSALLYSPFPPKLSERTISYQTFM
jgi:hypothetical protein